jgi:uncharacterized protein YjbI with pentapeptide repeats
MFRQIQESTVKAAKEVCNQCGGNGRIGSREGLTNVICRYCYGTGQRNTGVMDGSVVEGDFKSTYLTRITLCNIKFISSDFTGTCLREAKILSCKFEESKLIDTNLSLIELINTEFSKSHLCSSVFINAKLNSTFFSSSDFWHCSFYSSKLNSVQFRDSAFQNATFYNCRFESVTFNNCFMKNVKFIDCKFIGSSFLQCNLDNSSFKQNEYSEYNFKDCRFLESDILLSSKEINFKKHLLRNNSYLAIYFEFTKGEPDFPASETEIRCIKYALKLSNEIDHGKYLSFKGKSFYSLWKAYKLTSETIIEEKKMAILKFWVSELYNSSVDFSEILELVKIVHPTAEQKSNQRSFDNYIANLIDWIIGPYG